MACIEFDVTVPNDKDKKLQRVVNRVAKTDANKATILASYFNNQNFIDYIKKESGVDNILDINGNTLAKLLRVYFENNTKSINNYIEDSNRESKNGFLTTNANKVAKDHTANILIDIHSRELNKSKAERLKPKQILNQARSYIVGNFVKSYAEPLYNDLKENGHEDFGKDGYETFETLKERHDSIIKTRNEKGLEYRELTNELKSNPDNKEAKSRLDELNKEARELNNDLFMFYSNLVSTYGNDRQKNYKTLVDHISSKPLEWFESVNTISKMSNFAREFDNILEQDRENQAIFSDEVDIINDESDGINEDSKHWSNSIGDYKDFGQHISGDVKLYFSTLKHLNEPNFTGTNYSYNTNNELGVPTTMSAAYVAVQISNYGDTSSLEAFINSIERASTNIPSLYGLSKMVYDMRANNQLARKIFVNSANPKIKKAMVSVSNAGLELDQSNKSVEAVTAMLYDLMNTARYNISDSFSVKDNSEIFKHMRVITDAKSNIDKFTKSRQDAIDNFIIDTLSKYFPNIDVNGIRSYIYSNQGDLITKYEDMLKNITQLVDSVESILEEQGNAQRKYNTEFREWAIGVRIANEAGIPYNKPRPEYDSSSVNYGAMQPALIQLAQKLVPYSAVKNELNSVNAEGNMGSDLISNNYITNMIKQIQFGTEEDVNKGLQNLLDFVNKAPQYKYSPIFYGITNKKGVTITPGLFIRDASGATKVNPNAKSILDIHLFTGSSDRANGKSALYSNMSKGDYFLSQLIAFNQPVHSANSPYKQEELSQHRAGYFMRTPSDAPKNFVVQAPVSHIWGLWNNVKKSENEYIDAEIKAITDKYLTNVELTEVQQDSADNSINNKNNNIDSKALYELLSNPPSTRTYNRRSSYKEVDGRILTTLNYTTESGSVVQVVLSGTPIKGASRPTMSDVSIDAVYSYETDRDGNMRFPIEFREDIKDTLIEKGIEDGGIVRNVNENHALFRGFYANLYGELNNFIHNLNNVFEKKDGEYVSKEDDKGLIDRYHYNNGVVAKDGKLTGQVFSFTRLFETMDYNVNANVMELLSLYGEVDASGNGGLITVDSKGKAKLNLNRTDIIREVDGRLELNINEDNVAILEDIVKNWINNYSSEINSRTKQYNTIVGDRFTKDQIQDAMFNNSLMEMNFDDLFEGDSRFYKNAQDFLKRAKEVQAGGKAHSGFDISHGIGEAIRELTNEDGSKQNILIDGKERLVPTKSINEITEQPLVARDGFRGVTIRNTVLNSRNIAGMNKELVGILSKNMPEAEARVVAKSITDGYKNINTNDAQSYITVEEFIRRKYAEGTLDEFMPLLSVLLDDTTELKDIDTNQFNKLIQVQKNFYYDKQYDVNTKTVYPRQIKNAEFVLIPKLIKGTDLETLYNTMKKYDIGQVNTVEADKAAKRDILTFWDNDGKVTDDNLKSFEEALIEDSSVESYYYRYLYKQQDVSEHMKDEMNRAGIQIMKKILDNASSASPQVRANVNNLFEAYVANIQEDYNTLMDRMGWETNDKGEFVNKDNKSSNLNFNEFYKRAREEAQRLGMDSNFVEYLTPDEMGIPTMPNYMNNVSSKLESIAQAMFNSAITRQKLPGWHAAQITNVGYSENLKYHPEVTDKDGKVIQKAYAEVKIPRWSNKLPKEFDAEWFEKEGIDLHMGYRIPTEGKQSVSILKVVGYVDDSLGSTIMLPDEWVNQTGADFDVDSVYGISYEMYKGKDGKPKRYIFNDKDGEKATADRYIVYVNSKIKDKAKANELNKLYREDKGEYMTQLESHAKELGIKSLEDFSNMSITEQNSRQARNNRILDSMIAIMEDDSSREENYSRSNFDDIIDSMKWVDSLREAQERMDGSTRSSVRSAYNPLDQIDFMENAVSGMQLKSFSVTRDTFNSVNNHMQSVLSESHRVPVVYDSTQYDIKVIKDAYGDNVKYDAKNKTITVLHDRLANSNTNRNVIGKLITPYSSQTTAHILDAVKEGAIFNENDYTFGTFKTLIDLGIDYKTAILFLQQPAITRMVESYFETKSLYVDAGGNPVDTSIKRIAIDLGINDNGNPITDYTPIKRVKKLLSSNLDINNALKQLFGAEFDINNNATYTNITLNGRMLENRFKYPKEYSNFTEATKDKVNITAAFDIGMALMFGKVNATTRNLEAIARVSNPDRFGAKQTIRATRQTRDNILEYIRDEESDSIGRTIFSKGEPFVSALYPGIQKGNIDVMKSGYPYLAAFIKYSTNPSIAVNSTLFPIEGETYNNILNAVQANMGIRFTDEQHREYKQYMISDVYSNVPALTTPITIDDNGWLVPDDAIIESNEANGNLEYWDVERARIFGYDILHSDNIKIEDINNPTKEEINEFNLLTPAQKVAWIQTNFKDDSGIFGSLRVNMNNQKETRDKGVSSQHISYSDQVDDVEDLFVAFRNSFFSTNPLVKLASLDLVKYAFIVEGFKFKKGGISKIITNDALIKDVEHKGLNIIEQIKDSFVLYNNPNEATTEEFMDKFVRSHSDMVQEYNLGKPRVDTSGRANIGQRFNQMIKAEGMVYIPINEANQDLLDHLRISEHSPRSYIKISSYRTGAKEKTTTLYKQVPTESGVYLYPLNLLERNETSMYSVNKNNNKYKNENYYKALINEVDVRNNHMSSEANYTIDDVISDENMQDIVKDKDKSMTIPMRKSKFIVDSIENPRELERLMDNGSKVEKTQIGKFINDVTDYFNLPVEGRGASAIIKSDSYSMYRAFPKGTIANQIIPINGVETNVRISNYTPTRNFNNLINKDSRGKVNKLIIDEVFAYQQAMDSKSPRPNLYKVDIITDEQLAKEEADIRAEVEAARDKQVQEEIDNNDDAFSIIGLIEDFDSEDSIDYDAADAVAKDIYNDIDKRNNIDKDKYTERFVNSMNFHEIDRNSAESIHNKRGSIFSAGASYYTHKSQQLLSAIDNFKGIDGSTYSIDDKALYEHIAKYPEDYPALVKLILEARTFGSQFAPIMDLNMVGEDVQTTKDINKIKKAINDVKNNTKLMKAMDLFFNQYMANEISTNPLVRHGLIDIKTQFGDASWLNMQISDIGELSNKQVQNVYKYVNGIINEAIQTKAPEAVDKFTEEYDAIMSEAGTFNMDNIITKEGKLISNYTNEFIEERDRLIENVNNAKDNYGIDSIEYIRAKLERDKFREKNIEQIVKQPYYEAINRNVEYILSNAPQLYVKYQTLVHEMYGDKNTKGNVLTEEQIKERKRINRLISTLTSKYDSHGNLKDTQSLNEAVALSKFIARKKELENEYFTYDEADGFRESLEHNLRIMEKYKKDKPYASLGELLSNEDYRDAYDWVQANSYHELDSESNKAIIDAFKTLKDDANNKSGEIGKIVEKANAYDSRGEIDARKLSKDDLDKIKEITSNKHTKHYDSDKGESILIKEVDPGIPALSNAFYEMLRDPSEKNPKVNTLRTATIARINEILSGIVDGNTGQISSKVMFEKLNEDELKELANLYKSLGNIKGKRSTKRQREKFKKNISFEVNQDAFNREWLYAVNNLKGTKQFDLWLDIFVQSDKDGVLLKDEKTDKYIPNNDIYGYMMPLDDTYIDHAKTDARNLIEHNVRFTTNEYYDLAAKEAEANGVFDEWYANNHMFNPYTHRMEPLRVWTNMEVDPNGTLKATYNYVPTNDNKDRYVKDEYKNDKYNQFNNNYNSDSGQYNNRTNLSEKESKMLKLLQDTINENAQTPNLKTFFKKGFMPRRAKQVADAKWIREQALGAMGLELRKSGEKRWTDNIDYANDRSVDFQMASLIKRQGYEERVPLAPRYKKESEADYKARVEENKAINKEIEAKNLKLDNEALDNDWKSVMQDFISRATEYNARQDVKNTIYLLLEDLKAGKAYQISRYSGNLKKDRNRSTQELDVFRTEDQTNTISFVENWLRRVVRQEFKKDSKMNDFAGLMQNITSAKYMVFNVTGGIANITTGWTNMLGEVLAKEYVDPKTMGQAQTQYTNNMLGFMADMYNEKSNNLTVALTKLYDVVDFDNITERRPNETASKYIRRTRDSLYALQSGGEHYMQNTLMLGMLKSHRIFTDSDGVTRAGSLTDYNWEVEMRTLMNMLENREDMLLEYKAFISSVKADLNELRKYDSFNRDFNQEFLRRLPNSKEMIAEYAIARNKALDKAKKDFSTFDTVESQYELKNGRASIKADSKFNSRMEGELREKVISVNKKIHGVYDKVGAARIESEWWGALVMQYHKHLYPGIMKRFRNKGYYNETRATREKGSYVSLYNLIAMEFDGIISNAKEEHKGDNAQIALKSISNIAKAAMDTFINFNTNYQSLPVWEKRNMRRALGDLLATTSAVLAAIIIHMATDEDELKDSNTLSTMLYLADRLNSESQMYTPWGMYSEAKTLWSSPIAAMNGPADLLKGLTIASQMIFDPEFESTYSTGLYKGQNKLEMVVRRNIPILRVVDRLNNMSRSNQYYRLGESELTLFNPKKIADSLAPEK